MRNRPLFVRIVLYPLYLGALLMYMLLYGSQYDWTVSDAFLPVERYPEIVPMENDSGDRALVRGLLVYSSLFLQLVICLSLSKAESFSTVTLLSLVLYMFW
jgi:hypothetical protein